MSVCSHFFLLVSLKFFLVLKSFNAVSRKFKGCLRFKGSPKGVYRGSFKSVSRKFQGSFKRFSKKFQGCFNYD